MTDSRRIPWVRANKQVLPPPGVFFAGRTAVLASMHGKEAAIAPVLEQAFGIRLVVAEGLDTDRFGTFTRDRERTGTALETVYRKAEAGLEHTAGADLAIASEGSFGAHPLMPFLPGNVELVALVDRRGGFRVCGQAISGSVCSGQKICSSLDEAEVFAQEHGFPSHGLVVYNVPGRGGIVKGIRDAQLYRDHVVRALDDAGQVQVEVDLRAHMNPTRMDVIRSAAQDLVKRLEVGCPVCNAPGWEVTEREPGLPCGGCGFPTRVPLAEWYRCARCGHGNRKLLPDREADPGFCLLCNP